MTGRAVSYYLQKQIWRYPIISHYHKLLTILTVYNFSCQIFHCWIRSCNILSKYIQYILWRKVILIDTSTKNIWHSQYHCSDCENHLTIIWHSEYHCSDCENYLFIQTSEKRFMKWSDITNTSMIFLSYSRIWIFLFVLKVNRFIKSIFLL